MADLNPTTADLDFVRNVMSNCPRGNGHEIHYVLGVLRSVLGMTENGTERTAEEMVRLARAAIVAYDERTTS